MHDELNELEQNKPLEETSFLDSCKAVPMQRFWKEMKDASLEVLKDRIGDDDTSIKRNYNWFKLEYGEADRKLIPFSLNDKKVFNALASGRVLRKHYAGTRQDGAGST